MTLLAIAEVMSGEALVSPGGPIDRDTAISDEILLWQQILELAGAAAGAEADEPAVPDRIAELVGPLG